MAHPAAAGANQAPWSVKMSLPRVSRIIGYDEIRQLVVRMAEENVLVESELARLTNTWRLHVRNSDCAPRWYLRVRSHERGWSASANCPNCRPRFVHTQHKCHSAYTQRRTWFVVDGYNPYCRNRKSAVRLLLHPAQPGAVALAHLTMGSRLPRISGGGVVMRKRLSMRAFHSLRRRHGIHREL